MREINLNNGMVSIVDDEDYIVLSQWSWHCRDGYARRTGYENGIAYTIRMHRQIMNCVHSEELVDHINHDTLDNRKSNLRICSKSQNLMNQIKKDPRATSKYKGVRYLKVNGYYQARITKDKGTILIGHFRSETAAANAYNHYALEYHGKFSCLNKVVYMSKAECEKYRVIRRSKK